MHEGLRLVYKPATPWRRTLISARTYVSSFNWDAVDNVLDTACASAVAGTDMLRGPGISKFPMQLPLNAPAQVQEEVYRNRVKRVYGCLNTLEAVMLHEEASWQLRWTSQLDRPINKCEDNDPSVLWHVKGVTMQHRWGHWLRQVPERRNVIDVAPGELVRMQQEKLDKVLLFPFGQKD